MTNEERIEFLETEVDTLKDQARELQASKADAYPVWDVARTTRQGIAPHG